jgi:hypothetical protein
MSSGEKLSRAHAGNISLTSEKLMGLDRVVLYKLSIHLISTAILPDPAQPSFWHPTRFSVFFQIFNVPFPSQSYIEILMVFTCAETCSYTSILVLADTKTL